MRLTTVRAAGRCSVNHARIWPRKTSESSNRQSTRYTVLPSSVSSRGAGGLRVTLGGNPTGLSTLSLLMAPSHSSISRFASPAAAAHTAPFAGSPRLRLRLTLLHLQVRLACGCGSHYHTRG